MNEWFMVVCAVEGGKTYRFFSEISGRGAPSVDVIRQWDASATEAMGEPAAVTGFYRLSEGPSDD